ncbi:hypothetical protein TOPH_07577 [Tolypocladium ophioglossoides CBS 100239]|uniref:Uncharacterized protein n=1 Tax=Tolypocladium ophioglossoides (strain CBS 100239) TaxID=1163406 RepID=A0A0L0N136_TOLOC|nr:hypothetical protein TOPH_07577 [Tolypocladium ophioglossoides CBS 100239]
MGPQRRKLPSLCASNSAAVAATLVRGSRTESSGEQVLNLPSPSAATCMPFTRFPSHRSATVRHVSLITHPEADAIRQSIARGWLNLDVDDLSAPSGFTGVCRPTPSRAPLHLQHGPFRPQGGPSAASVPIRLCESVMLHSAKLRKRNPSADQAFMLASLVTRASFAQASPAYTGHRHRRSSTTGPDAVPVWP